MKYRTIAAVLLAFSALQAAGGHIFSTMDANGNEVTSVLNPDGTPVATSNMVEKMIAEMPEPITPDYSTANTQLVATIEAVSPAPGNYAVVSNRAINAVTTNSLGSVTLSQVEDRDAVNYDESTVGDWMGAGYVITHGGDYYIVGYTFQKTALGWDNDVVAGNVRKMGAEGERCVTIGQYTSTAGTGNTAAGRYSFAEGNSTHAEGRYTHAEGAFTHAEGYCTHAEGESTHAEGYGTHAEGDYTHAEGDYTHAEGRETRAGGSYTHAEGELTDAVGYCTHAEGAFTHAEGYCTHAEGFGTAAEGNSTHAEGISTHAGGTATHAEGVRSVATNNMTFVWQGAAGRPYTDYDPETYPQYGSHGDGTFNINPAPAAGETDVASGFYIGERSLKSRIDAAIGAAIAATNTVFSNAVLSVGLNIDTNVVAVLNEIADGFGNFPLSPGATRTTVGGLLLALAAAVVWLKRNKADKSEIRYSIPAAIYESGTLIDYAVNNVICGNASIVLTLPAQVANRARDFLVRIDRVTTSGNLGVNFASADAGGTEVSYETVDGSKPTIADGEITTLLFTEVASGRFMVAAKPAVRVIGGI